MKTGARLEESEP